MKQTVNFNNFCDSFTGPYANKFSYDAKRALFDYLEDYETDTRTEIELDPIALACEYTEYKNLAEIVKEYGDEFKEDHGEEMTLEELQDRTQVIELPDGGLLIANY